MTVELGLLSRFVSCIKLTWIIASKRLSAIDWVKLDIGIGLVNAIRHRVKM